MEIKNVLKLIKESKSSTKVRCYLVGDIKNCIGKENLFYHTNDFGILIDEYENLKKFIQNNNDYIFDYDIQFSTRNSKINLYNYLDDDIRVEPGSIIRDHVVIKKGAIILMGAVINLCAEIGENTMIDMNAVIGARAIIGNNCHIGAGSVIAGVLEPPSSTPVVIEDNVVIGANAVILEGITIKKGAVVGAGSVVTKDVLENQVVFGNPARFVKYKDTKTMEKTKIVDDLRK